ncbi:MAG: hypothetical protein ACR2P8_10965 [Myxococcota bacterium]
MGWRDHALRLLARGIVSTSGEPLDPQVLIRVFDRIGADPTLASRLDELDEAGVRDELVDLYEAERD